jgi:hypothetical protein
MMLRDKNIRPDHLRGSNYLASPISKAYWLAQFFISITATHHKGGIHIRNFPAFQTFRFPGRPKVPPNDTLRRVKNFALFDWFEILGRAHQFPVYEPLDPMMGKKPL